MSDCRARLQLSNGKVVEFHGPADITRATTDAIVNAANSSLMGGGGVDGAIHRAGGDAILAACKAVVARIGRLPAGKAVATTGGRLAAKYVIHTVGPIYRGGGHSEAETLASCYRESIKVADENSVHSLAFPSISTGAYGYPLGEAAAIAVRAAVDALASAKCVTTVRFILFDAATLDAYAAVAEKLARSSPGASYQMEKGSS